MAFSLAPGHVEPPPAEPQRGGLLDHVTPGDPGADWRKGVHTYPESLAGYRLIQACSTAHLERGALATTPRPVAAAPFVIQAEVTGPFTGANAGLDYPAGRAERQLRAVTSQAVAAEFWGGQLTAQDDYTLLALAGDWTNPQPTTGHYTNPYLTAPGLLDVSTDGNGTSVALSPMAALGEVEAATRELVAGGPVLIHMPPSVVNEVAWALERVDGRLLTAAGSLVVADSGYPGDGPGNDATETWIYGTGPVVAWVESGVRTTDLANAVVDRRTNEVLVRAERDALYLFDPQTRTGCSVSPSTT